MKIKVAIIISSVLVLGGVAGWYFFIRRPNKLSEEDRAELRNTKGIE